jgi:hypothetical protein
MNDGQYQLRKELYPVYLNMGNFSCCMATILPHLKVKAIFPNMATGKHKA